MTKKDFMNKFKTKTKEITVKAWDNEPVEIRELTVSEANDVQSMMLKDTDTDVLSKGKVEVSISAIESSKIRAVSYALVNPKLSEEELSGLGNAARDGINEIYEALTELNKPGK